jgi:hypothetical protein
MYADFEFQVSAQPPAKKTAGLIEKELMNVEHPPAMHSGLS